MNTPKIHEIIRAKRRERDLTQEELANILGVTKAAVSKWETAESYPDITMLPQIAQLFHITMDELFGYTLEFQPLKIVNEINAGIRLSHMEDLSFLDHGTVKKCTLQKFLCNVGDTTESIWDVSVHFVSNEDDFPYIVQKCKIKVIDRGRIVFGKNYIPISESYKQEIQNYINSLSV